MRTVKCFPATVGCGHPRRRLVVTSVLALALVCLLLPGDAHAALVFCKKGKRITVRETSCKRKESTLPVSDLDVYTKAEVDALAGSIHPLSASTGVGTRCSADGTADGGPRAGQYDPCSSEIVLGTPGMHAVLLVAHIGWGMYQSGTGKGACHIERDGVAVPNSEVTMGETVKTTEESNAGGLNNRRLNWAGVTVVSGPNSGSAAYRVACREVVGDFQFNEISLSGVVTSP